jgi:hypothetical protein
MGFIAGEERASSPSTPPHPNPPTLPHPPAHAHPPAHPPPLPSVINGIQTSDVRNLFNPENIFISKEGGGAGNNWASGFSQGEAVQETLLDMIGGRDGAGGQGGGIGAQGREMLLAGL